MICFERIEFYANECPDTVQNRVLFAIQLKEQDGWRHYFSTSPIEYGNNMCAIYAYFRATNET